MSKVRASKYRHVFGTEYKKEQCYDNIRVTGSAFDSNFIKANSTSFAIQWQSAGGGSFAVVPFGVQGKLPADFPLVSGHAGNVQDLDFHPFHEELIASSSEDCTVKLWQIPAGGLTQTLSEPLVTLSGHQKRCGVIAFHPTAANVLASTSADGVAKLWDVSRGTCAVDVAGTHPDMIQSFAWSYDGSLAATSCKDKKLRLLDPRNPTPVAETEGHAGAKGSRILFAGKNNRLVSVGFGRTSERQFSIWDARSFAEPLGTCNLDNSSGMLMPFFDDDSNVLFLAGKGDGNIRYYEIIDEAPCYYFLSEYKSNVPQKGIAALPKRAVNTAKCEIARFYKVAGTAVIPIEFTVPRKGDQFQEDLFPDTRAWTPAMSADEYFAGQNTVPALVSLRPGATPGSGSGSAASASPATQAFSISGPAARVAELEAENAALKARVAELEKRLGGL
eukprot:TRINITY_DN11375_c0_g1_i1.p1 TRINITY_DN11375_c0_g1~~TRINITY_DN11375_c0_g1_i1.p1  ORF type:complete len:446 (-),score=61.60 TRINITY_DN11375_c0_g1_i1:302-1639(-)